MTIRHDRAGRFVLVSEREALIAEMVTTATRLSDAALRGLLNAMRSEAGIRQPGPIRVVGPSDRKRA